MILKWILETWSRVIFKMRFKKLKETTFFVNNVNK